MAVGTELAVGYVSLVPSGRGFGRSIIRQAQTAGGESATAFGSSFVSGMTRVAKRAAQAFTVFGGAAAFFGIRTAANFEQTRIAFEGILGDADEANKLLGELRDFAAVTPFEFTGLAESSRQLLAVGFAAEDIIPTMTTLGNVAATLGVGEAEIAGVVRALGQMRGKGKASAEELQQISEQIPGFSAITAIAEDMGITTAEAFDLMAKGAIPADDAIDAILAGMESFPGAAGAMDRQSKTLNGVLSTFRDTLSNMAIDFITPYLPALSSGVERFSGFLQDLAEDAKALIESEGFRQFKDTVAGVITDGLDAIVAWWDRNGESITGFFTDFWATIHPVLEDIGDIIWKTVLPALGEFGGWFTENGGTAAAAVLVLAGAVAKYAIAAFAAAINSLAAVWPIIAFAIAIGLLTAATTWLIEHTDIVDWLFKAFAWFANLAIIVWKAVTAVDALIERIKRLTTLKGWKDFLAPGGGNRGQNALEFIEGRAKGGPVRAGFPYVVGEDGPELAVFDRPGTIFSNHQVAAALAPAPAPAANGPTLVVQQHPGEDQVSAGMRALRHHQRIQLELAVA